MGCEESFCGSAHSKWLCGKNQARQSLSLIHIWLRCCCNMLGGVRIPICGEAAREDIRP